MYCQSWPYDDPAGRLAAALGASPRHRLYSGIGGTTPQDLVNRTAEAMQRGELDLALICSAEALATVRAAKKRGERLPWSHRKSSPFPWEPPHPSELAHEVLQAWETFPLLDTARRAKRGASLADDATEAATMMAAMSVVAAGNPHAWRPTALDAATVGTATPDNRYVGWPYTKHEVAVMDVDMSAALLLATREKADALGVERGPAAVPRAAGPTPRIRRASRSARTCRVRWRCRSPAGTRWLGSGCGPRRDRRVRPVLLLSLVAPVGL